jgi:hypothetical protein
MYANKILEGFVDAAQAASIGKSVVLRHGIFALTGANIMQSAGLFF